MNPKIGAWGMNKDYLNWIIFFIFTFPLFVLIGFIFAAASIEVESFEQMQLHAETVCHEQPMYARGYVFCDNTTYICNKDRCREIRRVGNDR